MNRIENYNYTNRIGQSKRISLPDDSGYILKFFRQRKQMLPIDEQKELIRKKIQYFGEYIPETILCETNNGEYYIKQKYIKGKTLAQINVSDLSSATLSKIIDLINKYLKYHREQGGELDLTGYQYYQGHIGRIERCFRNFFKIYQNFLTSTNIMISDDGDVYMVDICESTDSRLKGKIKNFCAKPFIKRTISNLEKALQQKINLESSTNKELLNTLCN